MAVIRARSLGQTWTGALVVLGTAALLIVLVCVALRSDALWTRTELNRLTPELEVEVQHPLTAPHLFQLGRGEVILRRKDSGAVLLASTNAAPHNSLHCSVDLAKTT